MRNNNNNNNNNNNTFLIQQQTPVGRDVGPLMSDDSIQDRHNRKTTQRRMKNTTLTDHSPMDSSFLSPEKS